jgi:hypothetical protein
MNDAPRTIPAIEIRVSVVDDRNRGLAAHAGVSEIPTSVYVAMFPTSDGTERSGTGFVDTIERCFIRRISPEYQHCQLVFSWIDVRGCETFTTFSTTMERPSEYVATSYRRRGWISFRLILGVAERKRVFKWCEDNRSSPFNTCGYYWNFLPCVPRCCAYDSGGSSYFCAEQVAAALQYSGVPEFVDVVPYRCTPDEIAARLQRMRDRSAAIPINLNMIFHPQSVFEAAASTSGMYAPILSQEGGSSSYRGDQSDPRFQSVPVRAVWEPRPDSLSPVYRSPFY